METEWQVGVCFPEILIPDKKINKQKWAVIACDQFTSNEDYWVRTSKAVGGAPSTLHIIVPEAHLSDGDIDERIRHAKQTMSDYIEDGVLVRLPKGVMLVERETPCGTRLGLVMAIDLDRYDIDYRRQPLIRATEQTVTERLPVRMKLREGAVIECPHVMLLIDDPGNTVIEPIFEARAQLPKMYETPLIQNGGHIRGWFVDEPEMLTSITDALEELKEKARDGMLFAVGDGNHSLASAKAVWEQHRLDLSEEERETDPLRFALVEVVNLYDHGISMHPIHRVLFNVDVPGALRMLVSILNSQGQDAAMIYTRGTRVHHNEGAQVIRFESKMSKGYIEVRNPKHELVTQTLTLALDALLKELPRARIDYIHGDEEFHALTKEHASLGFLMEPMRKEELFDSVVGFGVLPKKAFSMGMAEEKRYYFECRLLVNAEEETEEEPEAPEEPAEPELLAEQLPEEPAEPELLTEQIPEEPAEPGPMAEETPEEPAVSEPWAEEMLPTAESSGAVEDDAEFETESRTSRRRKRWLFGKRDQQ